MVTFKLTDKQAELLVSTLRESLRIAYLDSQYTLEDCDQLAQLTHAVVTDYTKIAVDN